MLGDQSSLTALNRIQKLTGGDCDGFGGNAGGVSAAELEVEVRDSPLLEDPCLGRGTGGVEGVAGADGCGVGDVSIRCSMVSVWLRGRGTGGAGLLVSRRMTPVELVGTLGPLVAEGVVGVVGTPSLVTELSEGKQRQIDLLYM